MSNVNGKISFNKTGKYSRTAKVNLPKKIYEQLNITEDDRDIEMNVVENKIIIKKVSKNYIKQCSTDIIKGKIVFNKSGKDSRTARFNLPKKIYEQLNITEDDRDIEMNVVENKIVINKHN
ncbi:hypothetical protein [Clostridium sp. VAP23]|uniref:AbrB/MazE/SpoVT family DNA-binding domain-containing protein n=1 Tax=Clostridium sp. VAP23 TaxID=2949981 RepID=UPI002079FC61|nr:hypothetical protein [Clostridium sp. VAP23]